MFKVQAFNIVLNLIYYSKLGYEFAYNTHFRDDKKMNAKSQSKIQNLFTKLLKHVLNKGRFSLR